MEKIFLGKLPLGSFLTNILTVNKPAMQKFLKNLSFGVPSLRYKINTHNMSGMGSRNTGCKVVKANYVCLNWGLNCGIRFNKPTHYLLHYEDFKTT